MKIKWIVLSDRYWNFHASKKAALKDAAGRRNCRVYEFKDLTRISG